MDSLKNRNLQLLAIALFCISVTATALDVIYSPTGLSLLGIARIALPVSVLFLLVAEYPRFKMTAARIPLLAIGFALVIMAAYIWISHYFFK
jgi:hypothetical protein